MQDLNNVYSSHIHTFYNFVYIIICFTNDFGILSLHAYSNIFIVVPEFPLPPDTSLIDTIINFFQSIGRRVRFYNSLSLSISYSYLQNLGHQTFYLIWFIHYKHFIICILSFKTSPHIILLDMEVNIPTIEPKYIQFTIVIHTKTLCCTKIMLYVQSIQLRHFRKLHFISNCKFFSYR